MRGFRFLTVFAAIWCSSTLPAFAYLDPGTGSIILQGLIGGAVVAGTMVSVYWQKLKSLLTRKKTPPPDKADKK